MIGKIVGYNAKGYRGRQEVTIALQAVNNIIPIKKNVEIVLKR